MGRRYELATIGIDEALQGFTSDPFGSAFPGSVGLRVPTFVPNNSDPKLNRYLFLLATNTLGAGQSVKLKGWRQYVTIGLSAPLTPSAVATRPVEFEVTTPGFRFPDGNISWHLVREPPQELAQRRPNTDMVNFAFQTAEQAALLYDTYTQSSSTGFYMLNLTAYTPPLGRFGTWEPIAGLGNIHDLRTAWRATEAWDSSLDEIVCGPARVSLYASVLQTNPGTRPKSNAPAVQSVGDPPEENFITKWNAQGPGGAESVGVQYWRVAGALIFEDC